MNIEQEKNQHDLNRSILFEQAEEDEITQTHDSAYEDDITPTASEESEEEISVLDREEITSLIQAELADFKESLDESDKKKSEKRMKETIDSIMLKVEINQKMHSDEIMSKIN